MSGNQGDGISTFASTVTGNRSAFNVRCGLSLDGGSGYAENVMTQNNGGNVNRQVSGGLQIRTNVCGTGTNCAAGTAASCP